MLNGCHAANWLCRFADFEPVFARSQFLFVNGRAVRDPLLRGAVRGAYQDFLARGRHPMVALYLEVPSQEVDVNVHPMKTEIRFREAGAVRGLIVGALKNALAEAVPFIFQCCSASVGSL